MSSTTKSTLKSTSLAPPALQKRKFIGFGSAAAASPTTTPAPTKRNAGLFGIAFAEAAVPPAITGAIEKRDGGYAPPDYTMTSGLIVPFILTKTITLTSTT